MGEWVKLGCIYSPSNELRHGKLLTHASNPVAHQLEGDLYRIFYNGRDYRNRSSIAAVDFDIKSLRIVRDYNQPLFLHGKPGSFYADGVSNGNIYKAGHKTYMMFMGWQTPAGGHWRGDIGRLELKKNFELVLDSAHPIMPLDDFDTLSFSYPWVVSNSGDDFEIWYGSTRTWNAGNGEMLHVLHHAKSADGLRWEKSGLAVPFQLGIAQAYSRPVVVSDPLGYRSMWFSYRCGSGRTYRIGYASQSMKGEPWVLRLTENGLDVSSSGWDSDMVEYPFVFDHSGSRYMLYNGNGYGKTGFGLAVFM